jgi:predicted nucleic acid-binding Zn finger protein
MNKDIRKVWFFKSSSSSRQYQTLLYEDCSTSCDCPGWTKRVSALGLRSCKHTRLVEAGFADEQCDKLQVMPGPVVKTAAEAAEFTAKFSKLDKQPKQSTAPKVRAFSFDE